MPPKLPFLTLILLISFASVNAVLFTPGLPNIAAYFHISPAFAQQTISWFLIGYTSGQLLYGPISNRFGRKPALYFGIAIQIISSLLCVYAGVIHAYWLLILARFTLAIGSGAGLNITFTLINECYSPKVASQKTAYLMLAFAVTPGLGVALGGLLNSTYGWMSCFYAGAVYGVIVFIFARALPETKVDKQALKFKRLYSAYKQQFNNIPLICGGMLMGSATCFVYLFAALAPFIAMNIYGMHSADYGAANLLPALGLVIGSLCSANLAKRYALKKLLITGISIIATGSILMYISMHTGMSVLWALFMPLVIVYFGLSLVMANASALAMSYADDKAHGAAVMNFINMGMATSLVLSMGYFTIRALLLPSSFLILCILMVVLLMRLTIPQTQ